MSHEIVGTGVVGYDRRQVRRAGKGVFHVRMIVRAKVSETREIELRIVAVPGDGMETSAKARPPESLVGRLRPFAHFVLRHVVAVYEIEIGGLAECRGRKLGVRRHARVIRINFALASKEIAEVVPPVLLMVFILL